jgi:GT2 family glycosyltransferase
MTPQDLETPQVSVIVPVFKQWHLVPGLLDSLGSQTRERRSFEVVLVDNEGPAAHREVPPGADRVIACPTPGSYAARNAGAASARSSWLAFTDADCLADPNWIESILRALTLDDTKVVLVGDVAMVSRDRPNVYEIYDLVKGFPIRRYIRKGYGITANLAVSAELFAAVDGFDGRRLSGGDADFCRRATAAGAHLRVLPDARVGHPARRTWQDLATKARRVKGGQLRHGTISRRLLVLAATLVPPVLAWSRLAVADHPLRMRLIAMLVQTALWGVELIECVRLLAGGAPERR